ncbi:cell envelope integrity protein TolA [Paracidovorax avenae]|uniref:cell envelope integrity protein TolA n=1 Tax=Paracidovorax avenae TaxID=80867 RepID=UPI0006B311E6|nr:cell envelope integrity protein TolA [Paracidovorax avenae]
MHAHNDRDQFAPTRPPGRLRAIALAVLVHAALIGALTWGVNWKTSADQPAIEAEIWSALPQQAAPAAVAPPPPPQPVQQPTPPAPPPPAPAPPPPPPPPKAAPDPREADIAIEREKKRLEQEKKERQLQAEQDRRERERKEQAEQDKKERQQKEKAQREKDQQQQREKEQREKDRREQQEKLEKQQAEKERQEQLQKKQAEDKRKADEKRKADAADAKRLEALRQENLRRMQGLAGATGGETATGNAQRSSGPSGSYGGKVAAKVRPNIVYPDAISDNLRTEVEVRASPDGTIVGIRVTKSSGNKSWDDAVVRALEKTDTLPRDVDGRVPSSLVIGFRPKD